MRSWRKIYAKTLDSPDVACLSDGAIVLLTFLIIAQDDSGYYPWDDTSIRRVTVTRTSWSRDVTEVFAGELVAAGIARMEQGGILLVKGEELNGKPRKDVDIELYVRDRHVNSTSTSRQQHVALEQSRVEQSRVDNTHHKNQQDSFEIPDWVDKNTWEDFLEMRRKIRAYPTPKAKALLIGTLDKLRQEGHDPKAVLEQSIMSNYKGVFAIKQNGASHGKSQGNAAPNSGAPLTKYTLPDGWPLLGSKPKTML